MTYETREVLAACYLGPNKGPHTGRRMLTHAIELDDHGAEVRVLCDRVELSSIADAGANVGHHADVPTCKPCAARLLRILRTPADNRLLQFDTTCVNSTGELINAMTERAQEISRRAFLRAVDPRELADVEHALGYDVYTMRGGLRMSKDWHVTYHRSVYDGRPCVYFVHSRIEHIFT